MRDRHLVVLVDGARAGQLIRRGGGLAFNYDDAYRRDPSATPLSLSMPKQLVEHAGAQVSTWLWGLLPDNENVLSRWAREFQASALDVLSLLATPIGRDCAGAVQFADEDEVDTLVTRSGHEERLSTGDVEALLQLLERDSTAWLGEPDRPGQFSLAGAQAKTALRFRDGQWWRPSGSAATSHIIKPGIQHAGDGMKLADQAVNEHLCLDAARRAGLVAARTEIQRFGDAVAVVVERFDRVVGQDGFLERIHQEDICQALGVSPTSKYEHDGGPGVPAIAALMNRVFGRADREAAALRFVDGLAWNWLIGGTDAHAKNYGLLLAGSEVRFAPLYDIASALPYWHPKKLRLAMGLGNDYRVWPWSNKWPDVSRDLGLDVDVVQQRVVDLATRAPEALARAASAPSITELGSALPQQLVEAVDAQCMRCLTVLA